MKKSITLFTCLLICQLIFAQNCEKISPYKDGMYLEYTNYNKKGKVKSIESHKVNSVSNSDGALEINLTSIEDKKSKTEKQYTLKCINGDFYIDMANYTSLKGDDSKNSFKVKASGDFIEFPNTMKAGDALKDGAIDLQIGSDDSFGTVATMQVSNRKVVESGSLTTKAGTFDGHKISFDYIFNLGIIKFRGSGIEWYVNGIGIVKSENYNKKGKLRWTRELTKITGN